MAWKVVFGKWSVVKMAWKVVFENAGLVWWILHILMQIPENRLMRVSRLESFAKFSSGYRRVAPPDGGCPRSIASRTYNLSITCHHAKIFSRSRKRWRLTCLGRLSSSLDHSLYSALSIFDGFCAIENSTLLLLSPLTPEPF